MRAMRLHAVEPSRTPAPLQLDQVRIPSPGKGELLLHVDACGVCRTELDQIEGRIEAHRLPVIPGHQVVGQVVDAGPGVDPGHVGMAVGVAWVGGACGNCQPCNRGLENLCTRFVATGCHRDGGYTEFMTVDAAFAIPIPAGLAPEYAAPLLCAGAVGHRALDLSALDHNTRLGLTGFGSSAHLVLQMARARFKGLRIAVFARNEEDRHFARELGADWAGDTGEESPFELDAIIDTTPAWRPVVAALRQLAPGGRLVINAIAKEDRDREALLDLDYARDLWREKSLRSVANLTRDDVRRCLALAAEHGIVPRVRTYPLEHANVALEAIRQGAAQGSLVLLP